MTQNVYDYRATPLVNQVASEAMDFINKLTGPGYNMAQICRWSVDAVAPHADNSVKAGLAREAALVLQQAIDLDRMVLACRRGAA